LRVLRRSDLLDHAGVLVAGDRASASSRSRTCRDGGPEAAVGVLEVRQHLPVRLAFGHGAHSSARRPAPGRALHAADREEVGAEAPRRKRGTGGSGWRPRAGRCPGRPAGVRKREGELVELREGAFDLPWSGPSSAPASPSIQVGLTSRISCSGLEPDQLPSDRVGRDHQSSASLATLRTARPRSCRSAPLISSARSGRAASFSRHSRISKR